MDTMKQEEVNKVHRLDIVVRRLCKFKNMKMKELAKKIGVEPPTLSKSLLNDNPREKSMARYADAFGVPVSDFVEYYHNPDGFELTHDEDGKVRIVPVGMNYRSISLHDDVVDIKNLPEEAHTFAPKTYKHKEEEIVDEETGEVVSATDAITAVFNYKGTKLYADTPNTIKDVANMISMLDTMENKELHDASLALLVDRYGIK